MPNCQDAALESSVPDAALVDAGEEHSATVVLGPEDQGGAGLAVSQTPSSVPFSAPVSQHMKQAMSPPGGSLPPQKRMGSPLTSPLVSQSLRRLERTPPSSSYAACNHAELISSLSAQGDKFFGLHVVTLHSYKKLLSFYEATSGSSSKNLVGEHSTLKEKYAAGTCCIEVVRAKLEGTQAKRDSVLKERDHLRAARDEMLQTHDRLLDQLNEMLQTHDRLLDHQAQIMDATLEGTRTLEGPGKLVRSSDVGRDVLFQHSCQALKKTIRAVQARLGKQSWRFLPPFGTR
ncbi:hypothetical protein LIER_13768 [Lithospermum erythrorhizon]|uniref:Uncharacterized protein n=1 Tax=Lithospermum erythrorhizon TaxID=34254 RepID=A0AAV3Q183_LITER